MKITEEEDEKKETLIYIQFSRLFYSTCIVERFIYDNDTL